MHHAERSGGPVAAAQKCATQPWPSAGPAEPVNDIETPAVGIY